MLVCFLGALIPFPVPYSLPISLFAATWYNDMGMMAWGPIIVLVAFATAANMVGDLIDYMIGRGAYYIMSKEDPEVETRWSKIILSRPKAIPGVIVLFGLTPLPDSLLMVPLGMVEYDIRKTMVFMYIGRFGMMFIFALAGIFSIDLIFSEGTGDDQFGWVFGIILLYILWALIVVMVKYKPKKKPEEISNETSNKVAKNNDKEIIE
jgi:membrane protein YqaA with SNARE-associated domain